MNGYAYLNGSRLDAVDPLGLRAWDGAGDTTICTYYDARACETTGELSLYYKEAGNICRGGNWIVNNAVSGGIIAAWVSAGNTASESEILNKIRQGLVSSDRSEVAVHGVSGIAGNMIDAYHNTAFEGAGVSSNYYGGNIWFQSIWPNPVPFDASGKSRFDPRRLVPAADETKSVGCF